jgi:hypothetical protein
MCRGRRGERDVLYICIYICVYVHVYIYIDVLMCVYIYICIEGESKTFFWAGCPPVARLLTRDGVFDPIEHRSWAKTGCSIRSNTARWPKTGCSTRSGAALWRSDVVCDPRWGVRSGRTSLLAQNQMFGPVGRRSLARGPMFDSIGRRSLAQGRMFGSVGRRSLARNRVFDSVGRGPLARGRMFDSVGLRVVWN